MELSVKLCGLSFTLLLVSTDATVIVQPQARFLVLLEVVGKILKDLLCLQLLCVELDTARCVRVSTDDYAAGRADMLEPFKQKGSTGQEEFLCFTRRWAWTTKKNRYIVERTQHGCARNPL